MLFSTPAFFFFFAAYFVLHLFLPLRFRLALIIVGSAIFYGYWNPLYIWIPFVMMSIAYWGAIWMDAAVQGDKKRRLIIVIAALLLPLVVVKYTNFIYADVLGLVAGFSGKLVDWNLPLGISFITFTLIAYVADVYSGRFRLERNAGMLSGLVLFFPHLIAGPILRPRELLPQLHRQRRLKGFGALSLLGLAIFSVGLLKKLVFADPISETVEQVFASEANNLTGLDYLIGIYGFAMQIYCDFSGYTDMAIGTALLLGVRLPTNFQRPYAATSIIDFWSRWHITLSKWLRDYLYIPLGGNRLGYKRQALNLFVTMGLGGLWHGANWTFVLWGLAHGMGISFVHAVRRFAFLHWLAKIPKPLAVILTFHFVAGCWILFRAPDMATAWRVASGPFLSSWGNAYDTAIKSAFPIFLIGAFLLVHRWDSHENIRRALKRLPKSVFWPSLVLIWLLAITISQGSSAKFIYFDF